MRVEKWTSDVLESFEDLPDPTGPLGVATPRTVYTLSADVINSNAVANTLMNINDLSFHVEAGHLYHFEATIFYTSVVNTTGSRWTISGPASPTAVSYWSEYTLTASTSTRNARANAYDMPSSCNASSIVNASMAQIRGFIKPSIGGTVTVRFASEVAKSAITAKAGSILEVW